MVNVNRPTNMPIEIFGFLCFDEPIAVGSLCRFSILWNIVSQDSSSSMEHTYKGPLLLKGKSTRIPLEVRLFTKMLMEVPKLLNYPFVQKNTLYKVIIHSNIQAQFIKMPLNLNVITVRPLYTYFDQFIPLLYHKLN